MDTFCKLLANRYFLKSQASHIFFLQFPLNKSFCNLDNIFTQTVDRSTLLQLCLYLLQSRQKIRRAETETHLGPDCKEFTPSDQTGCKDDFPGKPNPGRGSCGGVPQAEKGPLELLDAQLLQHFGPLQRVHVLELL